MAGQQSLAIFLDHGGVLIDGEQRPAQWRRLLGAYFIPRYGGTVEAWAAANDVVYGAYLDRYEHEVVGHPDMDYNGFREREQLRWLKGHFDHVGLELPPREEWLRIVDRADAWITERVRGPFPGAVEAVRELRRMGYPLYTASGEDSVPLRGYLRAVGIADCFREFYGPDLVNRPKQGVPYYARVFADAGVDPSQALVVDNTELALGWARECGARCVLVAPDPPTPSDFLSIHSLAELPALLQGGSSLPGRDR